METETISSNGAKLPDVLHVSTDTPILSQSFFLGNGFNIYGEADISGIIKPIVDFSQMGTRVFTFLGKEYLVPALISAIESTSTYYTGGTYDSREDYQNSVAAHVGVSGSTGAFSGEMQANYSSEFIQNSEYSFAYKNFHTQLAYLVLGDIGGYLTTEFKNRIADLPETVNQSNIGAFIDFFNEFGTFFTQKIVLGGSLQFYSGVSSESQLKSDKISLMVEAQYNGLFVKGSFDFEFTQSSEWQSYSSNSKTSFQATGGDPSIITSLLSSIDPLNPNPQTPSLYQQWYQSIDTDPAIVDMRLAGIWQLCGSKANVVEEAWSLFSGIMHPVLSADVQSKVLASPDNPPTPPVITLGGQWLKPVEQPQGPVGFQLLVVDGARVTEPSAVLWNKYYIPPTNWGPTPFYVKMYDDMFNDIYSNGLAQNKNLLVLASFGIDYNMVPTNTFANLLISAGGGKDLRHWMDNVDPGSTGGSWISLPATYVFAGFFGNGPNTGIEHLLFPGYTQGDPVHDSVNIILYRDPHTGKYTLGKGYN